MEKLPETIVGVDVSKAKLDVHFLPDGTDLQVDNTPVGIKKLLKKLPAVGEVFIVLEATGGYEERLVEKLLLAGHMTARVNPRQVRDFAKATGVLAKTDKIDAKVIAVFGQMLEPRTLEPVTETELEFQELVSRRKQLSDLRTAEKNRLEQARTKMSKVSIRKVVNLLEEEIKEINAEISKRMKGNDDWNDKLTILSSTPGVGEVTVAGIYLGTVPERCRE